MPDFPDIHALLCREKRVKKRVIAGLISGVIRPPSEASHRDRAALETFVQLEQLDAIAGLLTAARDKASQVFVARSE